MRWARSCCLAAAILALPAAAFAQARNGNVYDGLAHEPAAGPVRQDEQAAGVAPSQGTANAENRELENLDQQLTNQAAQDRRALPGGNANIYGVQPGGVVPITPGAGPGAGGGGAAAAGH